MVPIYEKIMDQIKAAVIIGELPKPGCITGLVGQKGAGKTTTFKSILYRNESEIQSPYSTQP